MMYAPWFAIPVAVLIVLTALFRSRRLLELIVLLSVFPVASVVDFSVGQSLFSISPPLLGAALLLPCALLHAHRWPAPAAARQMIRLYTPLLGFTLYALVSSVVIPIALEGKFQTALAMDRGGIVPLAWGRMNITQPGYLLFLVAFAILVTGELARRPQAIRRVIDAYIWCCYLAVAIGLYHFAANRFGWYFPYDMLYSRPEARSLAGYIREYRLGGLSLRQVYGSFSEPSTLAQFLLGALFGSVYWWMHGSAPARIKVLAVASLAVLGMTLSTTAYAGLAAGAVLLTARFFLAGRLRLATVALAAVLGSVLLAVWAFSNREFAGVEHLFDTVTELVLVQKGRSESYAIRLLVDQIALEGALDTYGLGLGWGSTRGSSLLIHLLGNAGVIGMGLLAVFVFKLKRQLSRTGSTPARGFVATALCGNLLGGIIAVPDINSTVAWLLLGVLAALSLSPAPAPAPCAAWYQPLPPAGRPEPAAVNFISPKTETL